MMRRCLLLLLTLLSFPAFAKDELVLALFADDRAALLERVRTALADPTDDLGTLLARVVESVEVGDRGQAPLAHPDRGSRHDGGPTRPASAATARV